MTALLFCFLAAAPNAVTYSVHEKTHAWEISDWAKAPRVFTATHGAPLREKPDANSSVVAELPFGVPVKVLQVVSPEPVTVGERTDRWYRVASEGKAGYLFGDVITSARFEDDFDGDKDLELATVAFTADFKIRIRFFEPKTKSETFIDVSPAGGAFLGMKGGSAYPEALKKEQAGLPLIHVGTHVEACADLADYWVSYPPKLALAQYGLVDPPNVATYKVEFQPAKKRALVRREKVEEEDKPPRQWTETWTLDGGVFVQTPSAP